MPIQSSASQPVLQCCELCNYHEGSRLNITTHCTSVHFTNQLNVFWVVLYYYYDYHRRHHHHHHHRDFLTSYRFEISMTLWEEHGLRVSEKEGLEMYEPNTVT